MNTVSLKTAQELAQADYPQYNTQWTWSESKGEPWNFRTKGSWGLQLDGVEENEPNSIKLFAAPTLDEILNRIALDFKYPCDIRIRYYEGGVTLEISDFKKGSTGMRLNRTAENVSKKLTKIWLNIYGQDNKLPTLLVEAAGIYWLQLKKEHLLRSENH